MAGSTISTTISKEIVLGNPGYLPPLTITSSGRIAAPAPVTNFQSAAAIYVNVSSATIDNLGLISGAISSTDSYVAPAIFALSSLSLINSGTIEGMSGVYLQGGGTVSNTGSIAGLDDSARDGYGVRLENSELVNFGSVYGKSYGAGALNASQVINNAGGTLFGETAGIELISYNGSPGTLVNAGHIGGGVSGVTEVSALITNSGTITGASYGIRTSWGGAISNSGQISGGIDGVLLLNEKYLPSYATSFNNTGTILGGYFAIALNFATVSNAAHGLISGATYGAGVGDLGNFFNAGEVTATDGGLLVESGGDASNAGVILGTSIGVELFYDSAMTNAGAGFIYSQNTAALNQAAYLVNDGSIAGDVYGVKILSGGIVLNAGSIASQHEAVYLSTLSATSSPDFLGNTGYIYSRVLGLVLRNGTVENYGSINALQIAATLVTGTSLINAGGIHGGHYGVQLQNGSLDNSGSIGGGVDAIRITHGYITDSGTVSGGSYAIYGASFSLTLQPGAVFSGNVTDKSNASKLFLGGDSPATLVGIGSQFNGFNTIDFQAGAHWLISGSTAALAGGQAVDGFEQGDTIILNGFSASSDSFVSGRGLVLSNSAASKTIAIAGSFSTANFIVTNTGTTETISLAAGAPCFAAGTRILTPRGEVPVQALQIGDEVIGRNGEERQIVWIGHRTIDLLRHPRPAQVQPIRIAAGALGEDVPQRDLFLSPDHALFIDAHLIPAQLLLNGLNVSQSAPARVTYYHLELAEHAVIFAEGAAAESYLETGNRNAFENTGGSMKLHPDFSALVRQERSCAPLLVSGEKLEEIRRRCVRRHALCRRSTATGAGAGIQV